MSSTNWRGVVQRKSWNATVFVIPGTAVSSNPRGQNILILRKESPFLRMPPLVRRPCLLNVFLGNEHDDETRIGIDPRLDVRLWFLPQRFASRTDRRHLRQRLSIHRQPLPHRDDSPQRMKVRCHSGLAFSRERCVALLPLSVPMLERMRPLFGSAHLGRGCPESFPSIGSSRHNQSSYQRGNRRVEPAAVLP